MTPSDQSGRRKPKSDSTALALMIGMVLAVAVTSGASFTAAGSGALQQALRGLGFGRDTEIQAEQRKQATALAEIERIISRMDSEIGSLTTRVTVAEANETAASDQLAKLDGSMVALSTDVKDLRTRSETGESWRKPVDHLNTAVTGARSDIVTLRSSLDAYDQSRRNDIATITRRLDRLEQATVARDATASAPNTAPRGGETAGSGGVMSLFGLRGSAPAEPRAGHVIDMGLGGH
jgi:chromosome segregation ATPase